MSENKHKDNSKTEEKSENKKQQLDRVKELEEEIENYKNQFSKLKDEYESVNSKAAQYLSTASYYKNEAESCKKDFERFKERNSNILNEAKAQASESVAKKLLPVLDNFDQALAQVDAEILRGFAMIYSSLQNILSDLGIVEITIKDESLNPEFHNCINTVKTEDEKLNGKIAEVYQKGYMFAESKKVIRPATVSVYTM